MINNTMLTKRLDTLSRLLDRKSKIIFIEGTGKDLSPILVYYTGFPLYSGLICHTETYDTLRIMETSFIEDYYENISIAICRLVTNNPGDVMNPLSKELYWMYSTAQL